MAKEAEANQPYLQKFDAYGERVDIIHTSQGWKFFKKEAAREKLIALPYVNGGNSRLH